MLTFNSLSPGLFHLFLFLLCLECFWPLLLVHVPLYSSTALGVSDEQCSLAGVVSGQLLYGDQHPRVDVLGVNSCSREHTSSLQYTALPPS